MKLPADVQRRLADVVALTDQVQAAVRDGEWLSAASLEERRRAALGTLLTRLAEEPALVASLQRALGEIETRGRHLIGEVDHHRRSVVREASTLATGRHAAREYARVSDSREQNP